MPASPPVSVHAIFDKVMQQGLVAPVQAPPPLGDNGVWTVRAMSPHRPSQETIHYDRWSGEEVMRIRFEDHKIADRIAAFGVTFCEGALFGRLNQVVGVIAALGVILPMAGINLLVALLADLAATRFFKKAV